MMVGYTRFSSLLLFMTLLPVTTPAQAQELRETVLVDGHAVSHPFPHYWEKMFGSGRAILSLRENYRRDLRSVKEVTGFEYVRFHAIFHDEVGIYSEDREGRPVYNFSYVGEIYDGLLAEGVKPFVELSFMPNQLAATQALHPFWYKPNVSPPKDWQKWDDLISAFAQYLIQRYGIEEVSSWYFEVWNEPNLDFWAGKPQQSTYWQLYDHTALALKKVNQRLRVGGPATAQAAWVGALIEHCDKNNVPLDFVSTHVYANDRSQDVFGTHENIPRNQMVCRAVKKVHEEIVASAKPQLPLIWSEYNATYKNETNVTDSTYMGPWLADTIRQCDGIVDMMSYWTFSDVFEEQGVVRTPFYGGYGLIAAGGIPKPAYRAFQVLHKLGDQRLAIDSDSALLTRRADGTLVLSAWNYFPPDAQGATKTLIVRFKNAAPRHATIWRVDTAHGDFHQAYRQMGEPRDPTQDEIARLRASTELNSEEINLTSDQVELQVPPHGLVVIELTP
jgi:xylan 1,4-beta-xylosidase